MSHRSLRVLARVTALLAASGAVAVTLAGTAEAQPALKVTTGPVTVSNVKIVGTSGVNYTAAPAGTPITITGSYAVDERGGAIDQVELGWAGSDAPIGCAYSGPSHKGTFSFDLGAPPHAGLNQVIVNFGQDFSCNTSGWWGSNTGPVIADVAVTTANSGSDGPAKLARVRLATTNSNTVLQSAGVIKVAGQYSWTVDTGGSINQIQVGWAGSSAPAACIEVGSGIVGPTTFSVNLGAMPAKGANYVVFGYAQLDQCTTSGWFVGTEYKAVGLAYNTHR